MKDKYNNAIAETGNRLERLNNELWKLRIQVRKEMGKLMRKMRIKAGISRQHMSCIMRLENFGTPIIDAIEGGTMFESDPKDYIRICRLNIKS